MSPITPTSYLSSSDYQALTPTQQLAANGAQSQLEDSQALASSLFGGTSATDSSNLLSSFEVQPTASTPSQEAANSALSVEQQSTSSILSGLEPSNSTLPASLYQFNTLTALIRHPVETMPNTSDFLSQFYSQNGLLVLPPETGTSVNTSA